jgi:TPR repeat protein
MRRPDAQLISRARRGDIAACLEAARKYLQGANGFPRHVPLGLEYLQQAEAVRADDTQQLVVESLDLYEIAAHGRLATLQAAARAGRSTAQLKLAIWLSLTAVDADEGMPWFRSAAAGGDATARKVLTSYSPEDLSEGRVISRLRVLKALPGIGWTDLLTFAMDRALMRGEPHVLFRALALGLESDAAPEPVLADKVLEALNYTSTLAPIPISVDRRAIEVLLDDCVARGSGSAALMLGHALSGHDVGSLRWESLVGGLNFRKASALLMRAADGGHLEAWTRLYEIHSNHNGSVANPPMARFCLEKAAAHGAVVAQRRLGATILRASGSLRDVEQGMHWLFEAAQAGDDLAHRLLCTFVLPVDGRDVDAGQALEAIAQANPGLALRLEVARHFGLTKLEAMTVDLVGGHRPWGLLVGRNPFIRHAKLSAPRAVPAISDVVQESLRRVVAQVAGGGVRGAEFQDFDLRHRMVRVKQVLQAYGLAESMFFARARSSDLDALRGGGRWARLAKVELDEALALPEGGTEASQGAN